MFSVIRAVKRVAIRRVVGAIAVERAIAQGFPESLHVPMRYIVHRRPDEEAQEVARDVEARRDEIARMSADGIDVLYSPKPGSADGASRPAPGARLKFSPARVAVTGKNRVWGTFLYLCSREHRARTILELGACAGLSALYLGRPDSCEQLVTIEGAEALAQIARETLSPIGHKAEVITALFDDALDRLELQDIDLAFIDGHHEKVATIHYFERIRPRLRHGALVVFDDVSWSADMREAWNELSCRPGFSVAIDLGVVGLCIWEGGNTSPKYFDLRSAAGGVKISRPMGWAVDHGAVIN